MKTIMDVHVNAATEQAVLKIGDKEIAFVNFQYYRGQNNHSEMLTFANKLADRYNCHNDLLEVCQEVAMSHHPRCKTQTTRIDGLETGAKCNCLAKKAKQAIAKATNA